MSVPVFLDLNEPEQVTELRSYLKSKGLDVAEENPDEGPLADLPQVITAANSLFESDIADADIESLFNSIVSIVCIIPLDRNESLVRVLCEQVGNGKRGDHRNASRVKILTTLFLGLDEQSRHRYIVYSTLMKLAGETDTMHLLNPDLKKIKKWVAQWDISTREYQHLLRLMHEGLIENQKGEQAFNVMLELLSTYTDDNASQAREDAHRCIVTCLADSNTYIMDHLLALKPVRVLEGELIHDLLRIFVSGKLEDYYSFYAHHQEFLNSMGLTHEQNIQKMRTLTFMSMTETHQEIDFKTIQKEMSLNEEEVEAFIIDVVRTKTVRAKIDQTNKKVMVASTTHRTFGKQQWQLLRDTLDEWQNNLSGILGSLHSLPKH